MESITNKLVDDLIEADYISEDQREQYAYAILCQIESAAVVCSILLISIVFNKFIYTIGFMWYFFMLRKRTGGYHVRSFVGCYVGTVCAYLGVIVFCGLFAEQTFLLVVLTFLAGIVIEGIGAINHPNICWNNWEMQKTSLIARWTLRLEVVVLMFLYWLEVSPMFIAFLSSGIILCAILLCIQNLKIGR